MKRVREIDPDAQQAQSYLKGLLSSKWKLNNDTAERSSAFNTPRVTPRNLTTVQIPLQKFDFNENPEEQGGEIASARQKPTNFELGLDRRLSAPFDNQRVTQMETPSTPPVPQVPTPGVRFPLASLYGVRIRPDVSSPLGLPSREPSTLSLMSPLFMNMNNMPAQLSSYSKSPAENNGPTH